MAAGPLQGVRILDFTHVWAGPLGTRILGDLGAEIIKVEAPWARGRARTPRASVMNPADKADHWNHQGVTNKLNRNKLGVCIDSKTAEGHQALRDLVRNVDVVIENFSARAMPSMGLGWETLRELNPRLIYVAMPGYGVSGPNRDFVAFGPSVEPMCGLTSVMGYGPDEPRVTATAVPDACGGVTAAAAVVTALHRRDQTGRGGFVELALQEAAIALFGEYFLLDQLEGTPRRIGNAHEDFSPHGVYRCAGEDDWIAIAVRRDDEWRALAALLPDGADRSEYASAAGRLAARDSLDQLLDGWTRSFDKIELADRLQAAGITAGAVMVTPDFLADPQVRARGFFVELGDEHVEPKPYPSLPLTIDGRRGDGWRRAPRLGEHNHQVLRDLLGMSDQEIAALQAQGVITDRPPD